MSATPTPSLPRATTPEPMGSGPSFNEATEAQDRMDRDAEVAAMREAWSASHPDTLDRMTIRGDGEYIVALQRIIGRLCSTIEGICEFGPLPPDLHARAPDQAERAERAIAFLRASLAPSRESGALPEGFVFGEEITRAFDALPPGCTIIATAKLDALRTLERDAARMREAAAEYVRWAQHLVHCAFVTSDHWKECDCGLAAMRAALAPSGEATTIPETSNG